MLKSKKLLILSLALVIIMIAGITMAYLSTFTVPKINTFTLGSNISIRLAEPMWDNINYENGPAGITDPLGMDLAENFVPGRVVPKNPSVKNTSQTGNNVWIAIKLGYTVGAIGNIAPDPADTYAALDVFTDINWVGVGVTPGRWEGKDAANTVFYYNVPVAPTNNTIDLFDRITIQSGVPYDQLHPFVINTKAYAIQAEGLSYTDAKTELDNLIAANP